MKIQGHRTKDKTLACRRSFFDFSAALLSALPVGATPQKHKSKGLRHRQTRQTDKQLSVCQLKKPRSENSLLKPSIQKKSESPETKTRYGTVNPSRGPAGLSSRPGVVYTHITRNRTTHAHLMYRITIVLFSFTLTAVVTQPRSIRPAHRAYPTLLATACHLSRETHARVLDNHKVRFWSTPTTDRR